MRAALTLRQLEAVAEYLLSLSLAAGGIPASSVREARSLLADACDLPEHRQRVAARLWRTPSSTILAHTQQHHPGFADGDLCERRKSGNADPEFSERCLREQVDSLLSHSLVKTVFARRPAGDDKGDLESRAEELVEWCLEEEIYDLSIVWSSKYYADLPTPPLFGHSPGLWVDCCAGFWDIAPTLGERAALQEAMGNLHEPRSELALRSPPGLFA